jgi:hypothetical protein
MKKLLVVLSVLFVVALLAGTALAQSMYDPEQRAAKLAAEKAAPVKIGGEFTFGTITNFTAEESNGGFANMYVDISLWPDDYNSLLIEIAGDNLMDSQGFFNMKNVYWEWATDVGKALDLPVTLKNTAGKTSLYTRKYEVSGLAYERPVRPAMDPIPWKFAVGTDKFIATLGVGFGAGFTLLPAAAEATRDLGVLVEIPSIGPASAELFYLAPNNADFTGIVGFNAKALGLLNEMVDFAGGFSYNLLDTIDRTSAGPDGLLGTADDVIAPQWAYGIGAKVKYNKISGAVSINGNDTNALNQLGIDAAFAATDVFGLDAALGLCMADGADTFQGAEVSVYAKVGVSKWSVGYQIKDNPVGPGFNYVNAVANAKGGLFVAVDTNF